ncbi:histidyl-tRNA synthetase [Propionicimonas paludicola]|uniref:Histidine--tRNA ligase n=1 Tax=Propionicimonas paludicola TaxID=185243 RepID=A0A2A9CQM7_9ACTN|nr:histidine--tRNA ligase [Propionicimonas paludicola]PFG16734.1 histidyl-tRNA synthetase [Propionicimonas paludicola]
MARPKPLSGFPEFTPAGRIVEQRVLASLADTFELHGFGSIETRAVEPMEQLTRKGEIDKEVFVVRRLHADADAPDELGLHFDLTVPFARYVLENAGHLQFPFRRYQIQKAWRGERPQEGRYREFTQADIDIVGAESLAAHHDVELPLVTLEALEKLHVDFGVPQATMSVNNRQLSEGFYRGLGVEDHLAVLQRVDKLDKIGPEAVAELLVNEVGLSRAAADKCLALAGIRSADASFVDQVEALGVEHPLLSAGLELLAAVVDEASRQVPGRLVADLKIARGLDYYTGTVYETTMAGYESMGSISSGGRYDSLASDGRTTYPGVGLSIGVSRILVPLVGKGVLTASRSVPSCVLVAVDAEETRSAAIATAAKLRARGIACEVAPKADKFGKQIRYADRRGIPFVWFSTDEVKDIRSGEQTLADPDAWLPPAGDLRPMVVKSPSA